MAGTAQIFPVVGSSFDAPNPLPTQDAADGAAGQPNPIVTIQTGGTDGTNLRTFSTDITGRMINVGAASSGTVVAGAPLLMAGYDGYYVRTLIVDGSGQLETSSLGLTLDSTGQISIGTSPTLIAASKANQAGLLITNPGPSTVYLGKSSVTTATGAILSGGASITLPVTSAIYGRVAAGTQTVSFLSLTE